MKDIGTLFREARRHKGYSRQKVSDITKIRLSFIEAIEKGEWEKLPSLSVVTGFVRSIAKALSLEEQLAVAVFKRDYPVQRVQVLQSLPGKKKEKGFMWTPKMTFISGVALVLLVIFGYLGFQYRRFISAPMLTVNTPQEGQVVKDNTLIVGGKTDGDATVKVNNQPTLVNEEGDFSAQIDVTKDTKNVIVESMSRSGRTTIVSRTIKVE